MAKELLPPVSEHSQNVPSLLGQAPRKGAAGTLTRVALDYMFRLHSSSSLQKFLPHKVGSFTVGDGLCGFDDLRSGFGARLNVQQSGRIDG